MARPSKKGFDYFSLDCGFFDDIKTRKLVRRCGSDAVTVYVALLCLIFKEGYYLNADEDLTFIVSEKTGLEESTCASCIVACVETGMFDSHLYFSERVLTSHGIQKRYQSICQQSRRSSRIDEYNLVSSEERAVSSEKNSVSSEEMHVNSDENGVSSGLSTQRKEKKSKVKKNKFFPSFNSSPSGSEWNDEKQNLLSLFFFQNLAKPEHEVDAFLAYNNEGGRDWSSLSDEQKADTARRWKQKPPQTPRFPLDFLSLWSKIYSALESLDAPDSVLRAALSDNISVAHGTKLVHLHCDSEELVRFIEERAIDIVRDDMISYAHKHKCSSFRYHVDTNQA